MYSWYAFDFHRPNSCISSFDNPPFTAEVAAPFRKEWSEKLPFMPNFLISALSLAVKYSLVKGSIVEWNNGVESGCGNRVNRFWIEETAHASLFEAPIVRVTSLQNRSVLEARRERISLSA